MDGTNTNTNPVNNNAGDGANNNNNQVNNAGTGNGTNNNNADFDFSKLDAILEKRMGGVLKSILKDNGVTDENELSGLISSYRNNKQSNAQKQNEELENLRKENAAYKTREKQAKIDNAVNATAKTLGIDTDKLSMMRYDLGDAVDGDKIDADKTKKVLEDLLQKAPWLKAENDGNGTGNNQNNNSGFKPGNTNKNNDNNKDERAEINRIRKLAGLKPIE